MVPPLSWMLLLVSFIVSPFMSWIYIPLVLLVIVLFCNVVLGLLYPCIHNPHVPMLFCSVLLVIVTLPLMRKRAPYPLLLLLVVLVMVRFWLLVLPMWMYIPWACACVMVVLSIRMLVSG